MHEPGAVLARIAELKKHGQEVRQERARIRAIMDGGIDGLYAVMAWQLGKQSLNRQQIASAYGTDIPTVNLLASGGDRLAQRVGRLPILKAPYSETEKVREAHQKRRDIVAGWDEYQRFELQFPQVGRWLPGYGETAWLLKVRRDRDDNPYPAIELRDSYDVWTGWYGLDSQPDDIVVERVVPLRVLRRAYPDIRWDEVADKLRKTRPGAGVPILGTPKPRGLNTSTYEGEQTGLIVDEYIDIHGTSLVIAELSLPLRYVPNPLGHVPTFVVARRPSYSRNISHWTHSIGLMSMMVKYNVLSMIAAEDSVFRETNIVGEMVGQEYQRGRFAVNMFTPGSRVEKPQGDSAFQIWQQIDRLERQIRIGSGYDVSQDGISPQSWATGQSVRELRAGANSIIAEYHTVLKHAVERLDERRLMMAAELWPNRKTRIFDMKEGGKETYTPSKDIGDVFRTRRIFGAMATWDDPTRAVTGLQLLQAQVLAVEDVQENLDGLDDPELTRQRNAARRAEEVLMQRLQAKTQEDPMADAALVEIMNDPKNKTEILRKYFTAQEPQMSPEEVAMMQGGAAPAPQGPPPSVTSILSRLTGAGAEGGVQTVGTMRR